MSIRFLGRTKKSAQDLAESLNLIFRLVQRDEEVMLGYPTDGKRDDRVCVIITQGKVTEATIQ
jgi:hypothetical protein